MIHAKLLLSWHDEFSEWVIMREAYSSKPEKPGQVSIITWAPQIVNDFHGEIQDVIEESGQDLDPEREYLLDLTITFEKFDDVVDTMLSGEVSACTYTDYDERIAGYTEIQGETDDDLL